MGLADESLWRLEPHVCRVCFGRILSRSSDEDGKRVYRCACCGASATAGTARALCSCGVKLNARSAGVRCEPNQNKSAEWPFEIVARQT